MTPKYLDLLYWPWFLDLLIPDLYCVCKFLFFTLRMIFWPIWPIPVVGEGKNLFLYTSWVLWLGPSKLYWQNTK